jgi:hypothetical protein
MPWNPTSSWSIVVIGRANATAAAGTDITILVIAVLADAGTAEDDGLLAACASAAPGGARCSAPGIFV